MFWIILAVAALIVAWISFPFDGGRTRAQRIAATDWHQCLEEQRRLRGLPRDITQRAHVNLLRWCHLRGNPHR